MQAVACDAFEHIFASAGALAFVNAYSGLPRYRLSLMPAQNVSSPVPSCHSSTLWEMTHDAERT